MNNTTILLLNLAFTLSEELWRSLRVLSPSATALVDNTLFDLHNTSDDTQPYSFS